jgi:hypothetical protein
MKHWSLGRLLLLGVGAFAALKLWPHGSATNERTARPPAVVRHANRDHGRCSRQFNSASAIPWTLFRFRRWAYSADGQTALLFRQDKDKFAPAANTAADFLRREFDSP